MFLTLHTSHHVLYEKNNLVVEKTAGIIVLQSMWEYVGVE